jgi:biofilm PGA synthesis N-glycosyltransferase PgaC
MFAEYCLSTLWAYLFAASIVLWFAGQFVQLPDTIRVNKLVPPGFTGLVLCGVCLMQFTVSAFIERRYERNSLRNLFWIVWYPMVYWMINLATTLVSFTKVALMGQRPRARWISPDRGIHQQPGKEMK